MVTSTCSQSGPNAVPSVIQVQRRWTMPDGIPKKNLSTSPIRVVSSQLPIQTTSTNRRSPLTISRRRRAASARRPPARSGAAAASGSADALLTLIAHEHLVAEVAPDLLVDLVEPGLEPDLGHVPRSR